jgi:hypothetical protein
MTLSLQARGWAMEQYEIRIVREGRAIRVYPSLQAGDYAAIRRGQTLAKGQEGFEVWRADRCVYTQQAEASHACL